MNVGVGVADPTLELFLWPLSISAVDSRIAGTEYTGFDLVVYMIYRAII